MKRKIKTDHLIIAFGFILVILADCLYLYLLTDDFLHRFNVLANHFGGSGGSKILDGAYSMKQKWHYFYWFAIPIYSFGFYFYFVFIALLYYIFSKKPKNENIVILINWFAGLFLYTAFGSLLTKYALGTQLARYLSIITVPVILLIAIFIKEKSYWFNNKFSHVTIIILAVSSLFALNFDQLRHEDSYSDIKAAEYIAQFNNMQIFSTPKTCRALKFINKYEKNNQIKSLSESENNIPSNSIIIENIHRLKLAKFRHGEIYNIKTENLIKIKEINNPAPYSAYLQANIMLWFAKHIPLFPKFIKRELESQLTEHLDVPDVNIYKTVYDS